MRSYKFRLYPKKSQITIFNKWLNECCWLFNMLIDERQVEWQTNNRTLTYFEQTSRLKHLKKDRQSLKDVYSQVLQDVARRVDNAYFLFYSMLKKNPPKAGVPKPKDACDYCSFTYPVYDRVCKLSGTNLKLGKIGTVYVEAHRDIIGKIKAATIKREYDGKWYVILTVDENPTRRSGAGDIVGIDIGISKFITISNGNTVANPRLFRLAKTKINKLKRRAKRFGTKSSRLALLRFIKKVKNQRRNFHHQISSQLVATYSGIVVEDVLVNQMLKGYLRTDLIDVGWKQFITILEYKAKEAGIRFIKVNPAYTSQDCSSCGYRQYKKLGEREHNCEQCGLTIDRDLNGALNILARGLASLGAKP